MSLKKIRTLEKQMVKLKNDLAKEVKKLKPEPIQDYVVLLNGKKKHLCWLRHLGVLFMG